MTTNRPLPTEALLRAARALRASLIVQGFVRWSVLSAGGLLALLMVDDLLHLPQALRLPLGLVLGGFILVELYRKVLSLVLRPLSPARAARLLEMNRSIAGNILINAYQFEQDRSHVGWKKFVGPIIDSSSSVLSEIPVRSLWLTPQLKKWFVGWILLLAAWLLLALVFPRYMTTGIERIFLPLADIPPVGNWNIEVQPSGHIMLVEGDKLDISVRLKSNLGLNIKPPTPVMVWREGANTSESSSDAGEHASMLPTSKPNEFVFSFSAVSQPFSFRVWADDSRSSSVRVDVAPLPQMKESTFEVTPPAYTGLKPYSQPGPPATLEVPQGSSVKATLQLSSDSPKVSWHEEKETTDLTRASSGWQITRLVNESKSYELLVSLPGQAQPRLLSQGQLTAIPDRPPEVDFVTQDRNRAVNPGETLPVTIRATDDYGVASISLRLAPSDDPSNVRVLKAWTYLGPPGQTQPVPEAYSIPLDPAVFTPGSTFLLTAQAADFSPAHQQTISRPIIVRVTSLQDLAVPQGDALEKLFELLKNTIVQQTKANGLTDNLTLHLSEALAANDLLRHVGVMNDAQTQAQGLGMAALDEAGKHDEAKVYVSRLQSLVKGEMDLAIGQINDLPKTAQEKLPPALSSLQKRQAYILNELISLLGQIAGQRQQAAEASTQKPSETPPSVTTAQDLAKLKDELKAFIDDQKRIVDATKQFKELNPEDLTTDQQKVLGELARDEAKDAAFFQEKLTDLSKSPLQDFADGKLVQDMNEVFQEVQDSSDDLYKSQPEQAFPVAQAALVKTQEIEQNIEKWLLPPAQQSDTKFAMQEPTSQTDVPLADLPAQLDDVIGDLLNQEQSLDDQDASSSMLTSNNKPGTALADGPISDMSATGITGNILPKPDEIAGRSGEGRNGTSNGQMVGDTAVGKGGNETPTRMTPAPYENSSVNDTSKDTKGGATGGGKVAGSGQEGLRGDLPPPVQQKLHVLEDDQAKLRQQAESLALQLRRQRRPTGDLESAINGMKELEASAHNQNGLGVVQGYHHALDALAAARAAYAGDRLSLVEADSLTRDAHKDVYDAQAEGTPAGYEEMTSAYFRSLSEAPSTATPPPSK